MCKKFDHKVEKCNDLILFVFLGSLYGRMTVHESCKCVKMNRVLMCERLLFLPAVPGIQSLFGFPPCHFSNPSASGEDWDILGTGIRFLGLCAESLGSGCFFFSLSITGF